MSAVFEYNDIHFIYPENWTLSSDCDTNETLPWEISLETPEGGIWSLHIFPFNTDAQELLAATKDALSTQYEDVEFSDADEEISDCNAAGLDAFFYCLDFLVTAKTRVIQTDRYTIALCYQAENREFDQVQEVFRAITASLLKSMVTAGM